MEPFGHSESYEVVFFIEDDGSAVTKEMLFTEFEALLDGYVGLSDVANDEKKAVYVVINRHLEIRALVFFLIGFDDSGYTEATWNVPLTALVDIASMGPDLGGGPAKIAHAADCNIPAQGEKLWTPDLSPGSATLEAIKTAVQRNRLSLLAEARDSAASPSTPPAAAPAVAAPVVPAATAAPVAAAGADAGLADILREQNERIARLTSERNAEIQEIQSAHRIELDSYMQETQRLRDDLRARSERLSEMKNQAKREAEQIGELRSEMNQLRQGGGGQSAGISELRSQIEAETESRLTNEIAQLKDVIGKQKTQLNAAKQRESELKSELTELQEESRQGLPEGGGGLLQQLHELGVVFVSYHPGAGHMPIPVDDLGKYKESPAAYVAAKCNVTPGQYEQWLKHWESPVCQAEVAGKPCGHRLDRVEQPAKYLHGTSNLCASCRLKAGGSAGA